MASQLRKGTVQLKVLKKETRAQSVVTAVFTLGVYVRLPDCVSLLIFCVV